MIFLRRASIRGIRVWTSSMRAMKTWSSIASASVAASVLTGWKLSIISSLMRVISFGHGHDHGDENGLL